MSLLKPKDNSRVGVTFNNGIYSISSIINEVEVDNDSPFWSIYFGKRVNNGEGPPLDDRGVVILEESLVRDILNQIDVRRKGGGECVEYR